KETEAISLLALTGMGGIGKTALAQMVARDEVVHQAFPDGVVWITFGNESGLDVILTNLREVAKALGDDVLNYDNETAARNQYRTLVQQKAALLILDDVWNRKDLEPFTALSARSRILFTTRDARIARFSGADEVEVPPLSPEQSRDLVARWAQ